MRREKTPLLMEAKKIRKVFPGTTALNDVDFQIYGGKINVLVGENGAGKSTLMKIIAGIERQTEGRLLLYDEHGIANEASFANTREAAAQGVQIVHQELNLFSHLDVAENIFMGREIKKSNGITIDHPRQQRLAREVLRRLGQSIDVTRPVRDLRLGQQQLVEIAKTMIDQPRILIMDEPTSSLSVQEVHVLFRVINDLKNEGVGIVYISHRLEEIKEIGDRVTILRDAKLIDSCDLDDIELPEMIEKMVGRDPKQFFSGQSHQTHGELLHVKNMTLPRFGGGCTLDHVSFTVKKGEILGIYGLMGAGRTELLESLMGMYDNAEGEIWIDGERVDHRSTRERIESGLVLIPEERQRQGLFLNLSVSRNLTAASIHKMTRWFHIRKDVENERVNQMISAKRIGIKVSSPSALVSALSGGNQQKVVIGKALLTKPKVLLMDEPTRGIDIGAKSDVFEIMNGMANGNFGVVLVSSELEEIFSMSDRILVISKGKVTGEFRRSEATEEAVRRASEVGHGITVPV